MNVCESESELISLFKIPFEPKKIIFPLHSDFFHDGNLICKIGKKQLAVDIDDEELLHSPLPKFPCDEHGCRVEFTTVHDYEIHYRSAHTIVCSECKKSFPSYNLLDLHIQEHHDTYLEAAKDKNLPVLNCLVESCNCMFSSSKQRNEHAIKIHNYPTNFKFHQLKTHEKPEEMDITSCEASGVSTSKSRKSPPRNICFGRGSARAFMRKNKNKLKSSSTDITMKELADAL